MSCISGKDSPINICLEKHLREGTQKKGKKLRGMEGESESKNEPEREDRERRKSRRNK